MTTLSKGDIVLHTVKRLYTQRNGSILNKPTQHKCTVLKAGELTCLVQFDNKVVKTVKTGSLQRLDMLHA